MIEILNSIICYNNMKEVVEYVSKVSELECSEKVAVAVVVNKLDNGKVSDLINRLKSINIESLVVQPISNLGYLNGMLEGYKAFVRQQDASNLKYVIMSNTDINYPDPAFIKKLLNKNYPCEVWSIGPAVYVPERKSYDNPVLDERRSKKDVKRIIKRFRTPIFNEFYFHLSNIKGKIIRQKIGISHKVYEVHGCYFVINRELAEKMVDMPFGALLYSEEAYVAEMVWHNNKISYYDSNLLVEHNEHSVTGKINYKKLSQYIADSMEVILRDFY